MSRKKAPAAIAIFEEKTIRRIWHDEEWYFSVIDVVAALTDSEIPRRYWTDMKRRLTDEGFNEVYANCVQLKLPAPDGKMRQTDCASTETLLRIIQSIPSPRAEPFKRWLAQVATERLAEIANPELLTERQREYYKAKGYPEDWIEARMRGITVRNVLTTHGKSAARKKVSNTRS